MFYVWVSCEFSRVFSCVFLVGFLVGVVWCLIVLLAVSTEKDFQSCYLRPKIFNNCFHTCSKFYELATVTQQSDY